MAGTLLKEITGTKASIQVNQFEFISLQEVERTVNGTKILFITPYFVYKDQINTLCFNTPCFMNLDIRIITMGPVEITGARSIIAYKCIVRLLVDKQAPKQNFIWLYLHPPSYIIEFIFSKQ